MVIYFPESNLPGISQEWSDKVETEIKKADKRISSIVIPDPSEYVGPQGETGPAGIDGQDGLSGPQGAPGVDGQDGIDGKDGVNGLDGADGVDGKDGLNGFDGRNGTNGINGLNGKEGKPGKDGKDGKQGLTGKIGLTGKAGKAGTNGTDGAKGDTGDSAYEIAVQKGFVGSEKQWLESLRGKAGKDGKQGLNGGGGGMGPAGPEGPIGPAGADGPAGIGIPTGGVAGDILTKISPTNYDAVWATPSAPITTDATQVHMYVKNGSGVALSKGQAVYVSGANGTNILVSLAKADSEVTSSQTIGLLETNLSINGFGYVVTQGLLAGFDTSAAVEGDPIWLSPTTAGGLIFGIANKPYAPNHLVYLGTVTKANPSTGEVYVKTQNGFELDEIHNVDTKSVAPTDGQVLTYEASTSLWKPKTIATSGEVRSAWASPYSYIGTAPLNTLDSATGWYLTRIQVANNGTTTTLHCASGIWNNRASEVYV